MTLTTILLNAMATAENEAQPTEELAEVLTEKAEDLQKVAETVIQSPQHIDTVIQQLIVWALDAGKHILAAIVVYIIGHYLIKLIKHILMGIMERRKVDVTIQSFLRSFVNVVLQVLLIVSIVGALGINTTSFAALLASAGVAVGMALSGNLQNFAGGIIILLFKPYKVGDWVEAQGTGGTVKEIQIFHTILMTADGKLIYVPNGAMSSGTIINVTLTPTRRIEWVVGVEYGQDFDRVRQTCNDLIAADERIMKDPVPVIYLTELADSSVNVLIRAWVTNEDYWSVMFDFRERLYKRFNEEGIGFPFPQVTVHQES